MMTTKSHQNYIDVSSKVSMLKPSTQIVYQSLNNGMKSKMVDEVGISTTNNTSNSAALQIIKYKIENQVFALTFIQLVETIGLIFLLSFIPWYFLKLKGPVKVVDAH
jgi:DHA2 family multidrug resistance protein